MTTDSTYRQTAQSPTLLARLTASGSQLGLQLTAALDMSLRSYLKQLIPKRSGNSPNRHLLRIVDVLARTLESQGHPDVDTICSHFLDTPVIQQADHSNLLLDEETFLNNLLFAVACREAGAKWMITSQCSTVSCLSRRDPIAGPVFLRTRRRLYNVFAFSNRTYKNASFCALPGPLSMRLDIIGNYDNGRSLVRDPILARLVGRSAADAPQLYRLCNDEIWSALDDSVTIPRVGVDEAMTSQLAASHIEDSNSPVHRLLFEVPVRDHFLNIKCRLVNSAGNFGVNRAPPDFLWYRKGDRLVPVLLRGIGNKARFVLESDGQPLPVPYEAKAIAQALRSGLLYVDRIIAYFVRCLLPGVIAVGGTSQQDYVALYQKMMLECQMACPFMDEMEAENVSRSGASRVGGAPLLELDDEQRETVANINHGTSLGAFLLPVLERTIGETIGNLDCARYLEVSQ